MEEQRLSITKRERKHHVVFIPKCRRRTVCVQLRPHLKEVLCQLAGQNERDGIGECNAHLIV